MNTPNQPCPQTPNQTPQQTPKSKSWLKRHSKAIRNTLLGLALVGGSTYAINSCSTSQERYESGETEAKIEITIKEQKVLIEAYNEYFDEYEAMGKKLVELQSEGDLAGYKNTFKQRETLRKEIKSVEKNIDDLAEDLQDLKFDNTEGKRQVASEITPIPHAKGKERRTFKEYQ
jgi:hypothetical protein